MLVVLILSLSNIWRTKKICNIKRECSFYKDSDEGYHYIIPTIAFTRTDKFFEIKFQWFNLMYYAAYCLEFMDDD